MKSYKGYEITAINTNGFWYPYVSLNNKAVKTGSDSRGFIERDVAIAVAEAQVSLIIDEHYCKGIQDEIPFQEGDNEDYLSSFLYGVDNNNCESREGE